MNKTPILKMKRSKSSNPILVSRSSQTLMRHKSFFIDEKDDRKSQGDQPDIKLEKMFMEAQESFRKGEYENALIKFCHGTKMNPRNESFALGVKKTKNAIMNDLTSSNGIMKQLQDEITKYPLSKKMTDDNASFTPKEKPASIALGYKNEEMSDLVEAKSETMKAAVMKIKEKKLEPTYNLTINDGTCYKTIAATAQDVREYLKDKDYFKLKDQTKKDWKKLRSEFNKKLAEREAAKRYEREAKLLEERSNIRKHCDEQIALIGRHYQNGKMNDVIRFSENFVKYLNRKADKIIPRKWIYLATAFNYLARVNADQGEFEKAKMYGEKLYKIAITSSNTDLIAQSYILSGKIYVKFHKYKEAAFVWEKLIPLITDNEKRAWLFHEIGRCYFEMGKYDTSLKNGIESAYWAGKCSSSTWSCAAHVLLGQTEMKRNNYEEASKKFSEAKKHAQLSEDHDQTLKYINSMQELLNIIINKNRVKTSNESSSNESNKECGSVSENEK